jgi:multidrug efflux pump subunit AcrA (membrane-fusion protein)
VRKNIIAGVVGLIAVLSISVSTSVYAASVIKVESVSSGSQTVLGSTVIPYKEVTLAAQLPGRVEHVAGKVGSTFSKGDLLVKIDDDDLLAKRSNVVAQINAAQASVQNAQTQYRREQVSPRSKDIGAMPGFGFPAMMDNQFTKPFFGKMMGDTDPDFNRHSDLVNSATMVSQAQSSLMQAWAALNEIDAKIKDSMAIAPFDGMILAKNVEVGDTVNPGQPLVRYGLVKYKRLKADVPSVLVNSLKVGMKVPVIINGDNKTVAKVAEIEPIADPNRHTVVVKFDLQTDVVASTGMYAEVYLPDSGSHKKSTVAIPKSSLLKGRSLPSILMVNDGRSELRVLRLGAELPDGKVIVSTGLKPGDQIIDHPPAGASEGWMPTE